VFASCKTNQVVVKFTNTSSEDFKSIDVRILGKEFALSDLKSGQSKAIKVDKSYRYCIIKVVTLSDTLMLIPTDYVGEKLYTSGRLKMQLSIVAKSDNKRRLHLKTTRDMQKL
jgi:hypothetical protein